MVNGKLRLKSVPYNSKNVNTYKNKQVSLPYFTLFQPDADMEAVCFRNSCRRLERPRMHFRFLLKMLGVPWLRFVAIAKQFAITRRLEY